MKTKLVTLICSILALSFILCGCSIEIIDDIGHELEAIPSSKYHYSLLSAEDRECYAHIVTGIRSMESEIVVPSEDAQHVLDIFFSVYYDYPEFFWIRTNKVGTRNTGLGKSIVYIEYTCSESERDMMQEEIDEYVDAVLLGISEDASDYMKMEYVYETIIRDTEYNINLDAENNYNIYGVFADHEVVCTGYAMGVSYLLEKLDIPCTFVAGTAGGNLHAWNLAICNNECCWIDATHGDPISYDYKNTPSGDMSNIDYSFLCFKDDLSNEFEYIADEEHKVPDCP